MTYGSRKFKSCLGIVCDRLEETHPNHATLSRSRHTRFQVVKSELYNQVVTQVARVAQINVTYLRAVRVGISACLAPTRHTKAVADRIGSMCRCLISFLDAAPVFPPTRESLLIYRTQRLS